MTREEAATWIKEYVMWGEYNKGEYKEALVMAIKALEQEKSETVTEFADRCRECGAKYGKLLKQGLCEDAISRQEVLDLVKKGVLVSNDNYDSVCKAINALPSVNPTISKDRIIQIIEGHKGCQTQINLTLSKIIKEIETL